MRHLLLPLLLLSPCSALAQFGAPSAASQARVNQLDVTPPGVPTLLTATPGNGQVSLTWTDPGDPDLAGYIVYWDTDSGEPYGNSTDVGDVLSHTVTSLTNDVLHYFAVSAYDAVPNESAVSNELSATPTVGETFAEMLNPTGNPIGGLFVDQAMVITQGTDTATTAANFMTLLSGAVNGDTIFIEESTHIDLLYNGNLQIPCGVTIASDRGRDKGGGVRSLGGIITSRYKATEAAQNTTFETQGAAACTTQPVTIAGLRGYGPLAYSWEDEDAVAFQDSMAGFIRATGSTDSLIVYNNQLLAWGKWILYCESFRCNFHHNDLRHTNSHGFGYLIWWGGTGSPSATATGEIYANFFESPRHAIDQQGDKTVGLRDERYNIFGYMVPYPGNATVNGHPSGQRAHRHDRNLYLQRDGSLFGQMANFWNMEADSMIFRENWLANIVNFNVDSKHNGSHTIDFVDVANDSLCLEPNPPLNPPDQRGNYADVGYLHLIPPSSAPNGNAGQWFYDDINFNGTRTCFHMTTDVTSTDLGAIASGEDLKLGADSAHVFQFFTDNRNADGTLPANLADGIAPSRFFNNTLPDAQAAFPKPSATVLGPDCAAPCTVTFTESGSTHPDGHAIVGWEWNLDDSSFVTPAFMDGQDWIGKEVIKFAAGHTVQHTYNTPGYYRVRQTAIDSYGVRGDSIYQIIVRPSTGNYVLTGVMFNSYDSTTPTDSLYTQYRIWNETLGSTTEVVDEVDVQTKYLHRTSADLEASITINNGNTIDASWRMYWKTSENGSDTVPSGFVGMRELRVFGMNDHQEPNGSKTDGWVGADSGTHAFGTIVAPYYAFRNDQYGYMIWTTTNAASTGTNPWHGIRMSSGNRLTAGPKAPTGVTPTPGDDSCSLSWTAPAGASTYSVYRSTTSNREYAVVATPGTNSHNDTGLADATTYYYRISADDAGGIESMWSAEVSCLTT